MRLSPRSPNLAEYLKCSMGGLPIETFRVLFLDPMHRLIADEQMQAGTVDRLALFPRTLFQRAMELQTAALILVHNHPSGCADPSKSDIAVTNQLMAIARTLDIDILGHVIVTASSHQILLPDLKTARGSAGTFDLRSDGGQARTGDFGSADERLSLALVNARRAIRRRILRDQLLDAPGLFGEPAWDMLLEVFVHQAEGRPISTSSLCIASGLSMTAALRVLPRMEEAGLVQREPDPADGRRNFILLAPAILQRLVAFFEEYDV
ncbi:JAB domain-containing protein [Sphingopyxis sp.]|uniref:JAB domain-containing protein n=1 Tax=Sphingopyxis sp. TaxID=1908224 RepID=UPI0025E51FA8|nr:JAB domain-containing protein [Sphingopyxis sp.]